MQTREVHARHTFELFERIPHNLEERNACVAESAYFIAMRRGFSPGHELEDWLTGENEVDARLFGAPREY
jgi:hypothetical protein